MCINQREGRSLEMRLLHVHVASSLIHSPGNSWLMVDSIHHRRLCGTPLMLCWVKASIFIVMIYFNHILITRGILLFSICTAFYWPSTICYSIPTLSLVWNSSGLESLDCDLQSWSTIMTAFSSLFYHLAAGISSLTTITSLGTFYFCVLF